MSNYIIYQFLGEIYLIEGVTKRKIRKFFRDVEGFWYFSEGKLLYEFSSHNVIPDDGPDPVIKLQELITLGWNACAWEEVWHAKPEAGEGWSGANIRGTTEQQLRFPKEERWRAVRAARERRLSCAA